MGLRDRMAHLRAAVSPRRGPRGQAHDRPLIVSDWQGSVQHFYHFLLGYLGPMARWMEETDTTRVAVRDCGPMNTWFEAFPPHYDVEVVSVSRALDEVIQQGHRVRVLTAMDEVARFQVTTLMSMRDAMLSAYAVGVVPYSGEIVIIDRATSDEFHGGPQSEKPKSGRDRRSVPNLQEVVAGLAFSGPHRVVDTANVPPVEQMTMFRGARAIVGQHGAGLVHMLWLPRGSVVVEILPPRNAKNADIFRELARCLGHRYLRVMQESAHSPVDPQVLERVLGDAGLLSEGGGSGAQ